MISQEMLKMWIGQRAHFIQARSNITSTIQLLDKLIKLYAKPTKSDAPVIPEVKWWPLAVDSKTPMKIDKFLKIIQEVSDKDYKYDGSFKALMMMQELVMNVARYAGTPEMVMNEKAMDRWIKEYQSLFEDWRRKHRLLTLHTHRMPPFL